MAICDAFATFINGRPTPHKSYGVTMHKSTNLTLQLPLLIRRHATYALGYGNVDDWWAFIGLYSVSDCAYAETAISELLVKIMTSSLDSVGRPDFLKRGDNLVIRYCLQKCFFQCTDEKLPYFYFPSIWFWPNDQRRYWGGGRTPEWN